MKNIKKLLIPSVFGGSLLLSVCAFGIQVGNANQVHAEGEHIVNGITFEPWTKTDELPSSGNYYLTADATDNTYSFEITGDLNLDLNGFTATHNPAVEVVAHNVAYYDSVGTGSLLMHMFFDLRGDEATETYTNFDLYGVKVIEDGGYDLFSGDFMNKYCKIKLHQGTVIDMGMNYTNHVFPLFYDSDYLDIEDISIVNNGIGFSAISLYGPSIAAMHGGNISNCDIIDGAVYVNDGATFIMDGGSIRNNTTYMNGIIDVQMGEGKLYLGGTAKVIANTDGSDPRNIYLCEEKSAYLGTKTKEDEGNGCLKPTKDAMFGIQSENIEYPIILNSDNELDINYFEADISTQYVSRDEGKLYLKELDTGEYRVRRIQAEHGYVWVYSQKVCEGDTLNVWFEPDEGYDVDIDNISCYISDPANECEYTHTGNQFVFDIDQEGDVYVKGAFKAHTHAKQTTYDAVEPTCLIDGHFAYYDCACGKFFSDSSCSNLIGDLEALQKWLIGDGKIPATGHNIAKVDGKAATCTADGYKDAYKCSKCNEYYEDEAATLSIPDYEAWKLGEGKIPAAGHNVTKVDGKAPTCTGSGYKDAYKCDTCGNYFEDQAATKPIANYESWKSNEGKIAALDHDIVKVEGKAPTETEDGYKEAYKCNRCGAYFEDQAATKPIANYESWKLNEGKLPKITPPAPEKECLSKGAIIGIAIGGFLLLLLLIYIIGFIVYKKNGKALKIVKPSYRWINKHIFGVEEEPNSSNQQ